MTTTDKIVSIIVPVYNVAQFLPECLESIINQTYKHLEIICVNDGSTDNSLFILKNYAKHDTRIKIITKQNQGLLAARIDGLKKASGEYILNVDSDDYIDLDTVERLLGYIEEYDTDAVHFQFYRKSDHGPKHPAQKITKSHFEPDFYDQLFSSRSLNPAWLNLFKRKKYDLNREIDFSISMSEDVEYNLSLFPNLDSILIVSDTFYHYRTNPDSISKKRSLANTIGRIESSCKAYTHLFLSVEQFGVKDIRKYKQLAAARFAVALGLLELELLTHTGAKNRKKNMSILTSLHNYMDRIKISDFVTTKYICRQAGKHSILIMIIQRRHFILGEIYAKIFSGVKHKVRRISQ